MFLDFLDGGDKIEIFLDVVDDVFGAIGDDDPVDLFGATLE